MRYYENIRLVYEIESRVRDLRRAAMPENGQRTQQQQPQQRQQEAPATKESIEERQPAAGPQQPRSTLQPQ